MKHHCFGWPAPGQPGDRQAASGNAGADAAKSGGSLTRPVDNHYGQSSSDPVRMPPAMKAGKIIRPHDPEKSGSRGAASDRPHSACCMARTELLFHGGNLHGMAVTAG